MSNYICYNKPMTAQSNTKIIAFVGLKGAGKSAAAERLAEHSVPRVTATDTHEMLEETARLIAAGQHTLLVDSLLSLEQLRTLQHAHPAAVTVVAILSSAHHRLLRCPDISAGDLTQYDWQQAEQTTIGAVITLADKYIVNDGTLDDFLQEVDTLLK